MLVAAARTPERPPAGLQTSFLEGRFTPRTVFMQIGGDSALATHAAGYVERVYVVDISGRFVHDVLMPLNARIVACDGVRIPVPEASVDLAWSGDFLEHCHARDAATHLENVRRSLAPGGEYFFTWNKPRLLAAAGFSSLWCWLGGARLPWAARALLPHKLLRFSAIA